LEEAGELVGAAGVEEMREELADVQEVLDCLKKALGVDNADMKKYQEKKILKNGGFKKRIYIESISMEDNNKWIDYYRQRKDKYPERPTPDKK